MNALTATYVGVDVAKDSLAVRSAHAANVVTVPNTPQALDAWLAGLPADSRLICEATGRHHRQLQQSCAKQRIALTCLNPARARDFAKSLGRLEKPTQSTRRCCRVMARNEGRRPLRFPRKRCAVWVTCSWPATR